MPLIRRGIVPALVAALVVMLLPNAGSAASAGFYDPPSTLPAANGAVVRSEPMTMLTSLSLGDTTIPGSATLLMYKSTDAAGKPVAVTGTYLEPAAPWTGSGDRPLVSYAEGTQGVDDACAPSKTLASVLSGGDGTTGIGYEIPSIDGLLAQGVAVVVTDYVGLGTTDRVHTYVNRVDEAHAVLDAARAALSLPGTSITKDSPIGLYGYSQGGGASAAAAELAPAYAPELNLKGAYAGAPPANLYEVLKSIDGTSLAGLVAWAINGVFAYRPGLKPVLGRLINAKGRAYLQKAKTQCLPDAMQAAGYHHTSEWTTTGKSAYVSLKRFPRLMAVLRQQLIGRRTPDVPVMVLSGTKDDIVDHAQAKQLAVDWCRRGANVTYQPVIQPLPAAGTGANHIEPSVLTSAQTESWLLDRLEGKAVTSNCSDIASMP